MMCRLGLAVLLLLAACSKKTTGSDDRPAAGSDPKPASANDGASKPAGSATAPAAWKLDSQPVDLSCGPRPLAMPAAAAPAAAGERALPRAQAIAVCQDQTSIDVVCTCLTGSADKWIAGTGLTAPVTCAAAPQGNATARLVELHSAPTDPGGVAAGTAYAVVAAHGSQWSAVNVIEYAPDVDLTMTPKATHGASIKKFETRPRADGTVLWIESDNQYSETAMGEQEVNGAAALTICVVPTAPPQPAYCYAKVLLAAWDYTFTFEKAGKDDACEVRKAGALSASLDSAGGLTVRLDRGTDKIGAAGRYHL
jgi:hypothetical protein